MVHLIAHIQDDYIVLSMADACFLLNYLSKSASAVRICDDVKLHKIKLSIKIIANGCLSAMTSFERVALLASSPC